MTTTKVTETVWDPAKKLLTTTISGDIEEEDLENWERSLQKALTEIEANSTFRIFVNLHGFTAANISVHKKFRNIIPLTLAGYGWKVGYVDLFEEEAKAIQYFRTRGITCVGAAHSHHDATKMGLYETRFSRPNEHYFTDPEQAQTWLESLIFSN